MTEDKYTQLHKQCMESVANALFEAEVSVHIKEHLEANVAALVNTQFIQRCKENER